MAPPRPSRNAPKTRHVNAWCRDGLHLWCPNKAGNLGRHPCDCPCHTGTHRKETRR